MPAVKSLEELKRLKEDAIAKRNAKATAGNVQVTVAMGTCGIAAGARETMRAILDTIEVDSLSGVVVKQTGCMGMCELEPIVQVEIGGTPKVTYGKVNFDQAKRIMKEHVVGGQVVKELVIPTR
ncbi:MAG TPA: (2Fe-2S) ferredoxin domain-containing protein [Anaerolineae bacterium]